VKLKISICLFILASLIGCGDEEINLTCADPLGSDAISIGHEVFTCFQEDINGCFWFHLDVSPPVLQSVYVEGHSIAMIIDVGAVECLGEVTQKPTTGFVFATEAIIGHGYVVRMEDGTYGRLFIDSWIVSGGQIVEVNLKRQYAY